MLNDDKKEQFTGKKYKAALLMSEGIKTQREIAKDVNTTEVTISRWKQDPEYKALIDKLTLENDLASRAGLLRAMYKGASLKEDNIKEDKSTHLDYMKGIAKVQGLESQNVNVTGAIVTTEHDLISDPEVLEAANALARKIAQSKEDDQ